jgi:integrase
LIWDYLEGRNPADHIVRYPEKKRRRYLAKEELPRFHRALKQESNETNRDAILILLYTGARKMNVLAMQWKDIDLDRAIWIIPETKNGEPQMVVLPMQAITLLKRRYKQRHFRYVFPGQGQAGHLGNLKKAWERLLDNAGIDDLWIHDLRRTVGSYLANFGASQDQIKMQLGHKDAQSLAHYVFPDPEYLRATVAELANFLEKSTLDEE